MGRIQFHSRVDENGILAIQIRLGKAAANSDVIVTIEFTPNSAISKAVNELSLNSYGACHALELNEPEDMPLDVMAQNETVESDSELT